MLCDIQYGTTTGILKQGLRIAPPEGQWSSYFVPALFSSLLWKLAAPVTGYMFGKGAYFADMMSKVYAALNRYCLLPLTVFHSLLDTVTLSMRHFSREVICY